MTITVGDVISNVAQHFGLDPILCQADAWIESGMTANRVQVGVPLSEAGLGLFQLTPGGELPPNWTQAEAFNPANNCEIALAEFAGILQHFPGAPAGAIAFLAQRPYTTIKPYPTTPGEAMLTTYAQDVQAVYNAVRAGRAPTGFEAAANVPAGIPLPYPPAPVPQPLEVEMLFIAESPTGEAMFLYDVESKTRRGLSQPASVTLLEAVGIKNYGATLDKSVLVGFTPGANWD